jgi:hypothetical protein
MGKIMETKENTIYIERKPTLYQATKKKVGREPGLKDGEKAKRFMSYVKTLTLYKDGHDMIQFSNHEYTTNNAEDVKFIETHSAFGNGIWAEEFPKAVINKFEADKKMLTRDEEYFTPPER